MSLGVPRDPHKRRIVPTLLEICEMLLVAIVVNRPYSPSVSEFLDARDAIRRCDELETSAKDMISPNRAAIVFNVFPGPLPVTSSLRQTHFVFIVAGLQQLRCSKQLRKESKESPNWTKHHKHRQTLSQTKVGSHLFVLVRSLPARSQKRTLNFVQRRVLPLPWALACCFGDRVWRVVLVTALTIQSRR